MLRFLSCIPFAQMLINFSSNHPFRQDILLETSIQSKCCTVEQIAHVFDPVSMHTVRSCAFSSSAFFLFASLLFWFQYVCHLLLSALPVNSLPFTSNLSFLCVSQLGPIFYSKNVYSALHPLSHFLFVFLPSCWTASSDLIQIIGSTCNALSYCHNFLVLFQYQLTSVKLLREPP